MCSSDLDEPAAAKIHKSGATRQSVEHLPCKANTGGCLWSLSCEAPARRGGLLRGYEGDTRDATAQRFVIGKRGVGGGAGRRAGRGDGKLKWERRGNGDDDLEDSHVPMTGLARPSGSDVASPSVSSGAPKRLPPRRACAGCAGRDIGPGRKEPGY